jgi:hypothetical protein
MIVSSFARSIMRFGGYNPLGCPLRPTCQERQSIHGDHRDNRSGHCHGFPELFTCVCHGNNNEWSSLREAARRWNVQAARNALDLSRQSGQNESFKLSTDGWIVYAARRLLAAWRRRR